MRKDVLDKNLKGNLLASFASLIFYTTALTDEVLPVKGEAGDGMEDVIEDMADEHVQEPPTLVQLDDPEEPEQEQLPQEETEHAKQTEDAEQQEMIFSIAGQSSPNPPPPPFKTWEKMGRGGAGILVFFLN